MRDDVRETDPAERASHVDRRTLAAVHGVEVAADRIAQEAAGHGVKVLVAESGSVRRMFELTLLHLTLDVRTG